jgi:NO-binding membrane sensor protein with MHYT domain
MVPLLLAIPPAVALGVVGTWLARPDLHRDATLRGALILSVGIAAIEALVGALIVVFLMILSTAGEID